MFSPQITETSDALTAKATPSESSAVLKPTAFTSQHMRGLSIFQNVPGENGKHVTVVVLPPMIRTGPLSFDALRPGMFAFDRSGEEQVPQKLRGASADDLNSAGIKLFSFVNKAISEHQFDSNPWKDIRVFISGPTCPANKAPDSLAHCGVPATSQQLSLYMQKLGSIQSEDPDAAKINQVALAVTPFVTLYQIANGMFTPEQTRELNLNNRGIPSRDSTLLPNKANTVMFEPTNAQIFDQGKILIRREQPEGNIKPIDVTAKQTMLQNIGNFGKEYYSFKGTDAERQAKKTEMAGKILIEIGRAVIEISKFKSNEWSEFVSVNCPNDLRSEVVRLALTDRKFRDLDWSGLNEKLKQHNPEAQATAGGTFLNTATWFGGNFAKDPLVEAQTSIKEGNQAYNFSLEEQRIIDIRLKEIETLNPAPEGDKTNTSRSKIPIQTQRKKATGRSK